MDPVYRLFCTIGIPCTFIPKLYLKRKEALSFASKEPFLLQKKEYSVSGPVLNHCHREGREEYDCASSAWTFSEGDYNLARPEEDDDDIAKDEPLVM